MKITKKEKNILEKYFKIYEDNEIYELEAWTNGGVDMLIYINKENPGTIAEHLNDYINEFDIDEEIDLYRQDESYKKVFTITQSLKDFENWLDWIETIINELKGV